MQHDERREKLEKILGGLMKSETGADLLKGIMEGLGHRLMPRVEFMSLPEVTDPARLQAARHAVILDTETTGLDPRTDKVIQLSMLRVSYDDQGILSIGSIFDELHDPGFPICPKTTEIHGITDEMVAGKSITADQIRAFCDGCDAVIAHNAEFDRKFVEACYPDAGFQKMDWHCSMCECWM